MHATDGVPVSFGLIFSLYFRELIICNSGLGGDDSFPRGDEFVPLDILIRKLMMQSCILSDLGNIF